MDVRTADCLMGFWREIVRQGRKPSVQVVVKMARLLGHKIRNVEAYSIISAFCTDSVSPLSLSFEEVTASLNGLRKLTEAELRDRIYDAPSPLITLCIEEFELALPERSECLRYREVDVGVGRVDLLLVWQGAALAIEFKRDVVSEASVSQLIRYLSALRMRLGSQVYGVIAAPRFDANCLAVVHECSDIVAVKIDRDGIVGVRRLPEDRDLGNWECPQEAVDLRFDAPSLKTI